MLWDPATSGLKCGFCGSTKGVARDDAYVAVEYALESSSPGRSSGTDAPKVFDCDHCGAEVTFPGSRVAATCPFCGSAARRRARGERPDRILPRVGPPVRREFRRGKAKAIWRTWLGKGLFRPRRALERAATDVMRGVYVPFWTYDTKTWSRWTADAGYHHTRTVTSNGQTRTETRTEWLPASGQRTDAFDDVLVCASKGLDERLLTEAKPVRPEARPALPRSEYLSGLAAEEYMVDAARGLEPGPRGRERASRSPPARVTSRATRSATCACGPSTRT